MPTILQSGYEDAVRQKLGVKKGELPDADINQRLIVDLAEQTIIKRVPEYNLITDVVEKLLLEGSIISYICYLLAPGMSRRLNESVQTVDVKWKKAKVDWNEMAKFYVSEVEAQLNEITSVDVDGGYDSALVDIIRPDGGRIV